VRPVLPPTELRSTESYFAIANGFDGGRFTLSPVRFVVVSKLSLTILGWGLPTARIGYRWNS